MLAGGAALVLASLGAGSCLYPIEEPLAVGGQGAMDASGGSGAVLDPGEQPHPACAPDEVCVRSPNAWVLSEPGAACNLVKLSTCSECSCKAAPGTCNVWFEPFTEPGCAGLRKEHRFPRSCNDFPEPVYSVHLVTEPEGFHCKVTAATPSEGVVHDLYCRRPAVVCGEGKVCVPPGSPLLLEVDAPCGIAGYDTVKVTERELQGTVDECLCGCESCSGHGIRLYADPGCVNPVGVAASGGCVQIPGGALSYSHVPGGKCASRPRPIDAVQTLCMPQKAP